MRGSFEELSRKAAAGTLSAAEREWLDAHLREHPHKRADLEWDEAFAAKLEQKIAAMPARPGWERTAQALQAEQAAPARKHIAQLLAGSAPRLVEQARYLECRIAVDTKEKTAVTCLDGYRRAYPRSPHAADVLAMLVQLDHAAGGCSGAAARISELVQQHPASKLAVAWRARCPEQR